MYHYVYHITFESGHWYVGKKTSQLAPELDVKYNGSGVLLANFMKSSVHFAKEIVSTHETSKLAFEAERELLGDRYITESWLGGLGKCLNLIAGGKANSSADVTGDKNPFYGKTHSDEAKVKVSQANKGRLVGEKNPRYGVPCSHTGKFGAEHPMFGRTGESNANFRKKQFCNLSGQIIMADPNDPPEGFYPWTRWGFTDKTLRAQYPKELRGSWI